MSAPPRIVLVLLAVLSASSLAFDDSCGYEPVDRKDVGEPCTRSDECQSWLECRGGVCMELVVPDAGAPTHDAGHDAAIDDAGATSADAGPGEQIDAGADAGP